MDEFKIISFTGSSPGALKTAVDAWLSTSQEPTTAIWSTWTVLEVGGTWYAMVICVAP